MTLPHILPDAQTMDNFDELDLRFNPGPYTAPTLAGAWANTGGGVETAGYVRDPLGFVHLKGVVKSGAGTIFTLPTNCRPSLTQTFACDGDGAFASVTVTNAGVVALAVGTAVVGLSLDGITFKATQ